MNALGALASNTRTRQTPARTRLVPRTRSTGTPQNAFALILAASLACVPNRAQLSYQTPNTKVDGITQTLSQVHEAAAKREEWRRTFLALIWR